MRCHFVDCRAEAVEWVWCSFHADAMLGRLISVEEVHGEIFAADWLAAGANGHRAETGRLGLAGEPADRVAVLGERDAGQSCPRTGTPPHVAAGGSAGWPGEGAMSACGAGCGHCGACSLASEREPDVDALRRCGSCDVPMHWTDRGGMGPIRIPGLGEFCSDGCAADARFRLGPVPAAVSTATYLDRR